HKMSGFSTYPFQIFGQGWEQHMPAMEEFPYKGDTVIGNDVWIGFDALIMPGVNIGNGAIVAARSVVVGDVPAYGIVGGNPARQIRERFAPEVVRELQDIAWWNWPIADVSKHLPAIMGGNLDKLKAAAQNFAPDAGAARGSTVA